MAAPPSPRLISTGAAPVDFAITSDLTTIGSAPGNNFFIADSSVSRRHAMISRRGNRLQLTDLDATNGTYVNGNRISAPIDLNDGDEVRFGTAPFRLVNPAKDFPAANILSPRSASRITVLLVVAIVFAAGFAITQYVINFDRLQQVVDPSSTPANGESNIAPTAISSAAPARAATPVASLADAASPNSTSPTPAVASSVNVPESNPDADDLWLKPLNRYRESAGLRPVTVNPAFQPR